MKHIFFSSQLVFLSAFICCSHSMATTAVTPKDIDSWNADKITDTDVAWQTPQSGQYLKIKPNLNLWGFVGKRGIGKAQGIVPFGGDGVESVFFGAVDAAGSYSKSAGYSAGLGGGYRKIFDGSYILGVYAMVDYNRSPNAKSFVTINPGVEALTNTLDFRVNGYLPGGGSNWIGDPVVIIHTDPIVYPEFMRNYEEAGPGFDGEIGSVLPLPYVHGLKIYVGGYQFFMSKTSNVTGFEGRLTYPIWHWLGFEIRDSYDNVKKNALLFGLQVTLGGYTVEEQQGLGIAARLGEPMQHNFANFASGNTVPVNTKLVPTK